jgi:ubiquinone/menaquinone biosynthesis C-methylase UbiE
MRGRAGDGEGAATVDAGDDRWRANVRQDWVAAAAGWRHQDPRFTKILDTIATTIVEGARLRPGMRLLDVASGPGSSVLALARAVGPTGHVTASDLLPEMVMLIEELVAEAGVQNVSVALADAESLPFPDASFEAVTCHLGIVYFADVVRALREMRRVLQPGGQVTLTTWGPEAENPYFYNLIEPFWDVMDVPPPDPSLPSIFRFGSRGSLTARLESAGFERITEHVRTIRVPFDGGVDEYFRFVRGRAPTYERLAARLSPEQLARVDAGIVERVSRYLTPDGLRIPAVIVVATGRR